MSDFQKKYYIQGNSTEKVAKILLDIDDRLNELEKRVIKTDRKIQTPRAKQILLLHHLGFLEKLTELKLSGKKKAKLLSIILNASPDNIEGDLGQINLKHALIKNTENYSFLQKVFESVGLIDLAQESENEVNKLSKKKK